MKFTVREAAQLRRRLLIAMSMQEAKEVLGFPPGYDPSPREISKAWKALALQNHPDRGGDHRKMVELNVAKEVLEGKRHDRYKVEKDPAEEERRRQEQKRQAAIKSIENYLAGTQRAVNAFMGRLRSSFSQSWRINLRDYLLDDMPEVLDQLLDAADRAIESGDDAKRHWQKAKREAELVMGLGLRVGKKFGEMGQLLEHATDRELSFVELRLLAEAAPRFVTAFQALDKQAGALVTLINTAEKYGGTGETIPSWLTDRVYDVRSMVSEYREDFTQLQSFLAKESGSLGDTIEDAVEHVREELAEWGLASGLPPWEDWSIPDDFVAAIDLLTKHRVAADVSMEERVAARSLWEQERAN